MAGRVHQERCSYLGVSMGGGEVAVVSEGADGTGENLRSYLLRVVCEGGLEKRKGCVCRGRRG